MKRRELLKLGAQKAAQITAHAAGAVAALQGGNWLRPPFAADEPDFLEACTRCDKCIEACAYDVIFKLPETVRNSASGTPAMDLLNRGCHMCSDWPCVAACEPDALSLPEPMAPPKLAIVAIDPKVCLPYLGPECGACAGSCPVPGALEWQGPKPVINQEICTGCALCREVCIADPKAVSIAVM